jgi:hypothetical protein
METIFKDGSIIKFLDNNDYENFEFIVKIGKEYATGNHLIIDGAVRVSASEYSDLIESDALDTPMYDLDSDYNDSIIDAELNNNDSVLPLSQWISFSSYLKAINFNPYESGEPFINVLEHPSVRLINSDEFEIYIEFKDK